MGWDSLEAGLVALLEVFLPHARVLGEFRKEHDVFIWCGHFSSGVGGGPHWSAELLKALGDFGVSSRVDTYYPNK
jgi:hypothetical protein